VTYLYGMLLSVAVLLPGFLLSSLTLNGFIVGIFVGTTVYRGFKIAGFVMLFFFFFTGSILSKIREKRVVLCFDMEKGGRRDAWQVLANGGIALVGSVIYTLGIKEMLYLFTGAVATVTADTWATEIGLLSKAKPRFITNFKKVEPGISGGVTAYGVTAGIVGASVIGAIAFLFFKEIKIFFTTIIGGTVGFIMDSILGATIQRIGYCNRCKKFTEKLIHGCGERTEKIRGTNIINNDWVNFLSSLLGGVSAFLVALGVK